jgi:excisionase family DNA binding protein
MLLTSVTAAMTTTWPPPAPRSDRLESEPTDARTPSPYLTPHEACAYLRYASLGALYQAVRTHGIPVCRRGRSLLFPRRQLDRWLAGERRSDLRLEARRRSENVTPVLPKRSQKQTP